MSTETVTRPDTVLQTGQGTVKHRHYFRPPNDWPGDGASFASFAIINGIEIIALCGHRYIPDTEAHLPICQACVEAAANILSGQ